MTYDRLEQLQTWLLRLLIVTIVLIIVATAFGFQLGDLSTAKVGRLMGQLVRMPGLPRPQVALIAGHRGFDTGAMCDDGLMEVLITEDVAEAAAQILREEGVAVNVLDEYDSTLDGLKVDALVSIHADSCLNMSGFKIASGSETVMPEADGNLLACLQEHYKEATGLVAHPETVTEDMLGYHAFQRVDDRTPGVIIELGFLGDDRLLLTEQTEVVADGIARGVLCFLESKYPRDVQTVEPVDEPVEILGDT